TTLHKITYPFLRMIQDIHQATGAEFHMMSNVVKGNDEIRQMIQLYVPDAHYYPALHYDEFIKEVALSDMFLMTYPFSGFHTILDCHTQGLTGVIKSGEGMESQQGVVMAKRSKCVQSIANNDAEYFREAVELAQDEDLREMDEENNRKVFGSDLPSI